MNTHHATKFRIAVHELMIVAAGAEALIKCEAVDYEIKNPDYFKFMMQRAAALRVAIEQCHLTDEPTNVENMLNNYMGDPKEQLASLTIRKD